MKQQSETIPFHRPNIDVDDRRAVARVLGSGWLTTGKEAALFEREFEQYVNVPHALAVSSCTAALHLALELAEIRDRPVIVPTLTFTATAAAVLMAGANPIIVDIDEDTLTLTGEMLNRIKPPAKLGAIMPVHFGGNPSGLREIAQYCRLHGIAVIDDAAHALPAMVDGLTVGDPMLGTFATCFSFYPTKPVTTGEGGMLVSFSERNIEIAREMSLHGINADAYQRSRGGLYHYEVDRMGWKYNLPDILAALGRSQLAKSDIFHTRRQRIAGEYIAGLRPLIDKGVIHLPMIDDDCVSSWHLFVIRFQASRFASGWTRDRIAETLKERDITTSMHYRPLHLHPFWRSFTNGLSYPNADAAYREILSLPIYPDMPTKMVERVVGEIEIICRKAMR